MSPWTRNPRWILRTGRDSQPFRCHATQSICIHPHQARLPPKVPAYLRFAGQRLAVAGRWADGKYDVLIFIDLRLNARVWRNRGRVRDVPVVGSRSVRRNRRFLEEQRPLGVSDVSFVPVAFDRECSCLAWGQKHVDILMTLIRAYQASCLHSRSGGWHEKDTQDSDAGPAEGQRHAHYDDSDQATACGKLLTCPTRFRIGRFLFLRTSLKAVTNHRLASMMFSGASASCRQLAMFMGIRPVISNCAAVVKDLSLCANRAVNRSCARGGTLYSGRVLVRI